MRTEHAERCLERALAAVRQGMYHMAHREANKARAVLYDALYETEGGSLICRALADEKRVEAMRQQQQEATHG